MHVIVVGAGVIGVTTAWYLRSMGHTVEVIERSNGPAEATSFANAGQLSYGYAMPWAAPGVPLKALKWMFDKNAPFKLHLDTKQPLRQMRWLLRMFGQCNRADFERNKTHMLSISTYSKESLAALQTETNLSFHHQARGTLQLFRTVKQLEAGHTDAVLLNRSGVATELITQRERILELEPGLQHATASLIGGLYLPDAETGDCHAFTKQLAAMAEQHGVRFHYGEEFIGWKDSLQSNPLLQTSRSMYGYDAVVMCTGVYSAEALRALDFDYFGTLYPVKGYSLTYPVTAQTKAPVSTVMDETYKVAITRLGSRIRVGGTAELSGFNRTLRETRRQTLTRSVTDLFPGAGDVELADFWTGLRPSTPTGVPLVGQLPGQRVWVNFGHGTLGWTMAAGSSRALALMMSGRGHEVPPRVLSAFRRDR